MLAGGQACRPATVRIQGQHAAAWGAHTDVQQSLVQSQTLLKDQLELVRHKQPDGSTRHSLKPIETEFSFDKGFFMFIRSIQLLTEQNKDTIVVRAACRHPPPALRCSCSCSCVRYGALTWAQQQWGPLSSDSTRQLQCTLPPLFPCRHRPPRRLLSGVGGAGWALGFRQDCFLGEDQVFHPRLHVAINGQLQRRHQSH